MNPQDALFIDGKGRRFVVPVIAFIIFMFIAILFTHSNPTRVAFVLEAYLSIIVPIAGFAILAKKYLLNKKGE